MSHQSTIGKLSATRVRAAKPKEKAYKLCDGGGLYLYRPAEWLRMLAAELPPDTGREEGFTKPGNHPH